MKTFFTVCILFLIPPAASSLELELCLDIGQHYIIPKGEDLDNTIASVQSSYTGTGLVGISYIPGFTLGLTVNLAFSELWGLQTGISINYSESGIRVDAVFGSEVLYTDNIRFWDLHLPVLAYLSHELGILRLKAMAGFDVGYVFDAESYVKFSGSDPNIFPAEYTPLTVALNIGLSIGLYFNDDIFLDLKVVYMQQLNSFDDYPVLLNDTKRHVILFCLSPGIKF